MRDPKTAAGRALLAATTEPALLRSAIAMSKASVAAIVDGIESEAIEIGLLQAFDDVQRADRAEAAAPALNVSLIADVLQEHRLYSGDDFNPYPWCECDKWHEWDKPPTSWADHAAAAIIAASEETT